MTILLSSCCNEKDKVNEYVNDFVTTIQEGDVRAIHRMIPGLRHCEEFEIQDYNADSIVIQKQADGYHVHFSDHCSVVVLRDKSGKLSIGKTYGLAVFDADLYDFALRTGWISRDMDDAAICEHLAETAFRNYMIARISEDLLDNVTVTGGHSGGATMRGISVTVTNDTHYNIPSEAYTVLFKVMYKDNSQADEEIVFEGEDLPALSSKTMSGSSNGPGTNAETEVLLRFDPEWLPNLCMLIYKANGHEYADWKEEKLN